MSRTPELFPIYLNLHCLKHLQDNWCLEKNMCNEFLWMKQPSYSECRLANTLPLERWWSLKSLFCECKLRCLISDPERSAIFDLWSSCFETNLWVNVSSLIPVLKFIREMRSDEVLLSMDWKGHFSMYHITGRLLRLSFHIGRLRHLSNCRLTCDGTAKDGHWWPQNESKGSKQIEKWWFWK